MRVRCSRCSSYGYRHVTYDKGFILAGYGCKRPRSGPGCVAHATRPWSRHKFRPVCYRISSVVAVWYLENGPRRSREVRSPGIRPATEAVIWHNAPGLVENTHLKTLVFRFWVTQKITKPWQTVMLTRKTNTMPSFSEPTDCMRKPFS